MKKLILIILLGVITINCSTTDESDSVKAQIQGEWEWKESIGGMDGVTVHNPETDGHTRQLILSKGNAVLTINEEDTVQNTTYLIQREQSILNHQYYDVLTINYIIRTEEGNSDLIRPMRYLISEITKNSLQLSEDVYDGYGLIFMKK